MSQCMVYRLNWLQLNCPLILDNRVVCNIGAIFIIHSFFKFHWKMIILPKQHFVTPRNSPCGFKPHSLHNTTVIMWKANFASLAFCTKSYASHLDIRLKLCFRLCLVLRHLGHLVLISGIPMPLSTVWRWCRRQSLLIRFPARNHIKSYAEICKPAPGSYKAKC